LYFSSALAVVLAHQEFPLYGNQNFINFNKTTWIYVFSVESSVSAFGIEPLSVLKLFTVFLSMYITWLKMATAVLRWKLLNGPGRRVTKQKKWTVCCSCQSVLSLDWLLNQLSPVRAANYRQTRTLLITTDPYLWLTLFIMIRLNSVVHWWHEETNLR
jgi:hypothetical protein